MSNLRSFANLTEDEHKEISRKGGINSGIARQQRKKLKDELLAILSQGDVQERICTALIRNAEEGNLQAFSIIRDTVGERIPSEVNIGGNGANILAFIQQNFSEEVTRFYKDESLREKPLYGSLAERITPVACKESALMERFNREESESE